LSLSSARLIQSMPSHPPAPVAAQSKAQVCGRSPAEIAALNPAGGHGCLFIGSVCVLSGTGLCDEMIARPEESYWLWCVACDLENSWIRRPWPAVGLWREIQTKSPSHPTLRRPHYPPINVCISHTVTFLTLPHWNLKCISLFPICVTFHI
jgi:hypothetical protein